MDKFKAMSAFVRIAEEGSLTAAARALGSSLPAVVRSLASLEAHLGVRLLNRTTRRVALTDEGRHYLEKCRTVLAALDDAESTLVGEASQPCGTLTITAPVLFGQMHVAPAVARFLEHHDEMRVSVLLLDRMVNLLEEGIDLAIRIGRLEDSSLIAHPLGTVRRMVVASPDYLRRYGTPKHPRDLVNANCLRNSTATTAAWTFHEGARRFNVPVTGNLEYNHVAPLVEACAAGMGFGVFSSYQVLPYLRQKKLKVVLQTFEPPPRPISVVYPHARLLPARTRVFIAWIKRELSDFKP